MKTLEQLAFEMVMPNGGETNEHQEAEIAALIKFGKLVLENTSLPTKREPDAAKPRRRMVACPECETMFGVELS